MSDKSDAVSVTDEEWTEYKTKHNKSYIDTNDEHHHRNIFLENKKTLIEHNEKFLAGDVTYQMGVNHFSDMSQEERAAYRGGPMRRTYKSFGKVYDEPEEDELRKSLYLKTKIDITEHNKKFDAGEVSFTCGINQFADQKPQESACGCMLGKMYESDKSYK